MAIHAAMIDRMDREIGRVIDQLKTMKAYENTLIVFLSDNGASAEIMVRADGHDPKAAPGSAATYLCLGPGWSTTCNTPFRKHKTWVHEGGIATPFIARWPTTVEKRPTIDRPSHVIDLVPTILDLAGIEKPTRPGIGLFETPKASRELWWMHEGNRAVRRGDWKLVAVKDKPWELYDLSKDRAETKDIAGEKPDKAAELAKQWDSLWEGFQKDAQRP
jgi:arylsulfatase